MIKVSIYTVNNVIPLMRLKCKITSFILHQTVNIFLLTLEKMFI